MKDVYPLTEAQDDFDQLLRRVAEGHERITITDGEEPAAVLINPTDLADLEEALDVAEYRVRKATGDVASIPHAEVRRILGPPPE